MYIPRTWEFGSALAKLRNFGGGLNPPNPPSVRHRSLGLTGAVNINKLCLGSGAKLCFGFAQAIPGGPWLQGACIEQGFVFSLLCTAHCIVIAQMVTS
jgi:hypothetical protein